MGYSEDDGVENDAGHCVVNVDEENGGIGEHDEYDNDGDDDDEDVRGVASIWCASRFGLDRSPRCNFGCLVGSIDPLRLRDRSMSVDKVEVLSSPPFKRERVPWELSMNLSFRSKVSAFCGGVVRSPPISILCSRPHDENNPRENTPHTPR